MRNKDVTRACGADNVNASEYGFVPQVPTAAGHESAADERAGPASAFPTPVNSEREKSMTAIHPALAHTAGTQVRGIRQRGGCDSQ
jgi:hypothetical protein